MFGRVKEGLSEKNWRLGFWGEVFPAQPTILPQPTQVWLFKVDLLGLGVCLGVGGWLTTAAVPRVASEAQPPPPSPSCPIPGLIKAVSILLDQSQQPTGLQSAFPPTVLAWQSQGARGHLRRMATLFAALSWAGPGSALLEEKAKMHFLSFVGKSATMWR